MKLRRIFIYIFIYVQNVECSLSSCVCVIVAVEERGARSEEWGERREDWDIGLFIPHSLPVNLLSVTPMAGVVASKVRRAREKDLKEKHKKEEIGMGQLMVNKNIKLFVKILFP